MSSIASAGDNWTPERQMSRTGERADNVIGGMLGTKFPASKIEDGMSLEVSGDSGFQGDRPALLNPFVIKPGFFRQFSVAICRSTTMLYLFRDCPALILSHCQDQTKLFNSDLSEEKKVRSRG